MRVARGERETSIQRVQCAAGVAETEFQFCHALPGETGLRRVRRGLRCQIQRGSQRNFADGARLFVVGGGEKFSGELRAESRGIGLALHSGDELAQCVGEAGKAFGRLGGRQEGERGFRLLDWPTNTSAA